MAVFNHPEHRLVSPQQYIAAASAAESFKPLVLMPYLPGPEFSVDILADKGEILAAVGRRKEGVIQYLVNEGSARELACDCAGYEGRRAGECSDAKRCEWQPGAA